MKFTYSIQKADFFPDQVEEKGEIDLNGAIEVFQNFQFDEQLKEKWLNEDYTCSPTITYKNNKGNLLTIRAEDNRGFYLHYSNGSQVTDFYISNDYELNPKGFAVEDFIESFFTGKIEKQIPLHEKNKIEAPKPEDSGDQNPDIQIYSFKETSKFSHYFWTITFLLFALYFFLSEIESDFDLGFEIHLLVSCLWLPGTILHLTYWSKNLDATVTINKKAKTIEYRQGDKIIYFHRNDIEWCEINETRSHKAPWKSYKYLWIKLKDKGRIVITNFIVEPEVVIESLKLKYRTDQRIIPFLPV